MSKVGLLAARLISDWQDAYLAANGRAAPHVAYKNGWFVILGPFTARYRSSQFEAMTARLRQTAATCVSDENRNGENAERSRGEAIPARSSERGDAFSLSPKEQKGDN